MLNRFRGLLPIILVLSFIILMALPVLAQDTPTPEGTADQTAVPTAVVVTPPPVEQPGDSVKIPMPVLVLIGIVVLIFLAGLLLLLSQIIKALEGMYPPGTVTTMAKAIADGLEQIITQLNSNAPTTDTNADDFLLAITDPLTKAIIAKLREQGAVVLTNPGTNPYLDQTGVDAINKAASTPPPAVG